jgi:uncharacterized repeat protein (TIGR02543 family)
MSRRLSAVFAVAGLVGALTLGGAVSAAEASPVGPTAVGDFTFTADDADVPAGATLTAYSGSDAHVDIPSSVDLAGTTYAVTVVGTTAFQGKPSLVSVTIPDTVTSLGDFTFEDDTALASITIPDSVTTLGNNDFQNDTALVTAVVGNSVTGLPNSTFAGDTALTSLVIGNSVGGVGDGSVENDTSLTSVTFGDSVSGIGNFAFFGDSALTSVVLPATLTNLGESALDGAPDLDSVEFLGAPPGSIHDAGPGSSLGNADDLIVYYQWAFGDPQFAGGFTAGWHGFATAAIATVTFDLNGHGSAVSPEKVVVGNLATAPTPPTETGRIFNGWYTDAALTTRADFSDPITSDTTLFASWSVLAVTGQSLNPWLLPGGVALLALGLLVLAFYRRAGRAI